MKDSQTTKTQKVKDPVCGMDVDPSHSAGSFPYKGTNYHCCSKGCLEKFQKEPSRFLSDEGAPEKQEKSALKTYFPLILILAYLLGAISVVAWNARDFSLMTLMNNFMGGFFIAFSFFKFLDLKGFAESYQSYDILAKRSVVYSYLYPFIELGLGIAYLIHFYPLLTNLITAFVMGVSSIGVLQSVLRKQKIRCACLGTMFDLPMSTVTLLEDLLMFVMALIMVVFILSGVGGGM